MIKQFPQHVAEQLDYYVYLLVDPRTSERAPFYIGKGKANRVFDHLAERLAIDIEPTPKYDLIQEIRRAGLEPDVIIAAHRLNETEALRMEAVLIQLLGLPLLTNRVNGHDFAETMLHVDDLCLRYSAEKVDDEDIQERVLYVSLNGGDVECPYPQIRNNEAELLRRTLGDWPIAERKAEQTELVAGVYAQVVRVIFSVAKPGQCPLFNIVPCDKAPRLRFTSGTRLIDHPILNKIVQTRDGDTLTKFYQGSVRYGRAAYESKNIS